MGTIGEYIKSAIASIKNNKGRSFLTMLGIIIGIAAVLTILVIGDGLKAEASGQMSSLETTTIDISIDLSKTDKCFTPANMDAIEQSMNCIYGLSPQITLYGTGKGRKATYSIYLTGGSDVLSHSGSNKILYGRYFTRDDVEASNNVCVISETAAINLFGYVNAIGETIEITSEDMTSEFTVVGVRENTSLDKSYATQVDDKPVLTGDIPYTAAAQAYNYDVNSLFTDVKAYLHEDNKDIAMSKMKSVVENVTGLRGEDAVKVTASYGMDESTKNILSVVTIVIALIASISLIVGGIGVMNIMIVSVTERTREIGIRKSLGARTSSILVQFLAEAAILTFTGGVFGIVLGLFFAKMLCTGIGFTFIVNPILVIIVVGISISVGLFFGIYPANRASKLNPIDALRSE